MEDFSSKEIDYNWLIMQHLNRISALTTVLVGMPKEFVGDPSTIQAKNFMLSVKFLKAIIPRQLYDDTYMQDMESIKKIKVNAGSSGYYTVYLPVLTCTIDLLNRRGFLIQGKIEGVVSKRKPSEDEVFED